MKKATYILLSSLLFSNIALAEFKHINAIIFEDSIPVKVYYKPSNPLVRKTIQNKQEDYVIVGGLGNQLKVDIPRYGGSGPKSTIDVYYYNGKELQGQYFVFVKPSSPFLFSTDVRNKDPFIWVKNTPYSATNETGEEIMVDLQAYTYVFKE